MGDNEEFRPVNQETDPRYNAEPGIAVIPGSRAAREYAKFEQFHSRFTTGAAPGNEYRFREYPLMLYKASKWRGVVACIATVGPEEEYRDPRERERQEEAAIRFTAANQTIVKNDAEKARAFEQGFRDTPDDAVAFVLRRDDAIAKETAHRKYDDRNMSDAAKAEIRAVEAEVEDNVPEMPRAPVRRGRPKGSKNKKTTRRRKAD